MQRVLINGYIGFENFGDEAILHVLIRDLLKAGFKRDDIITASQNVQLTQNVHKIRAINRWDPIQMIGSIMWAEAIIFIGGIIQDKTSLQSFLYYFTIMLLAKLAGKSIVLYGGGIGPIQSGITKTLFNFIAQSFDMSTVRDQTSASLMPPRTHVVISCDPVWTIEVDYNIQKQVKGINWELPILGISLKSDKYLKSIRVSQIAEKLLKILRGQKDWQVMLIPCIPEDLNILYELYNYLTSKIPNPERIRLLDEFSFYPVTSQAGILASCDAVVGMRYHALLVPISQGKPVFGLIYDSKVKSLIETSEQVGADWKEDFDQVWEYFWQNTESAIQSARQVSEKAKTLHEKNIEILQRIRNS